MRRTLRLITAAAILTAAVLVATPASANHITKWDGFFWTQTRYVTSTQTLQAYYCVDQYDQDPSWLYVGNNSSQTFSYEVWFEAGTNPAIQWAYYARNVGPHSSFIFYPGITPKTQAYHPRWDVWRNGVHLAFMDIWGSTPGEMARGAAVSNC